MTARVDIVEARDNFHTGNKPLVKDKPKKKPKPPQPPRAEKENNGAKDARDVRFHARRNKRRSKPVRRGRQGRRGRLTKGPRRRGGGTGSRVTLIGSQASVEAYTDE